MGTIELRKKWIKSMTTVDERFLRMVDALYKSYTQEQEATDFFDELPKEIQELLMESLEQVKRGEVIPHNKVMADFRKKYNITG
ncbi:MAG: hypothetical protein JKZ03_04090 [Flavobacteriaceae bacterium]|nr:hypothetical protein [Flavobacteriaceae bacterium]